MDPVTSGYLNFTEQVRLIHPHLFPMLWVFHSVSKAHEVFSYLSMFMVLEAALTFLFLFSFFKVYFILIQERRGGERERERERKRERERNINWLPSAHTLTGESNPQSRYVPSLEIKPLTSFQLDQ